MKKTKTLVLRLNPQVAPRERRMDHNTVSRPKRLRQGTITLGAAETVEQFEARGGQIQRIAASWEYAA
ncbi:hypothetical protein [Stenotrophomonas maltophilia]|uniref:Uncharacterized protein n=1 Tax=Stenotrophomonas maltophilia TaxID=40324 RepID=A0AAP7L150_STEMA|nr:hypothetical protein [Stenotrophomonas maltophilia]OBU61962.1 hypothetical protein A9K56_07945 [Stenotrophomonas maltophilia]